jgi:hypothetical protein
MPKNTSYSELRNLLLVVSFNQPTGEMGQDIQPVVIEARAESLTLEGAVRNVVNKVNIGEPVTEKLTNEEIYKHVYGISPVLAKALEGVLLDGIEEDVSEVSTVGIKPVTVADIAVKPVIK